MRNITLKQMKSFKNPNTEQLIYIMEGTKILGTIAVSFREKALANSTMNVRNRVYAKIKELIGDDTFRVTNLSVLQ